MESSDEALQRRLHRLESRIQGQAREIRALEKIENLQDRNGSLEEDRNLREKVEELTAFLNLSRTLAATLNLDELFHLPLCLLGRSLHVDTYSLMRLEERTGRLVTQDDLTGLFNRRYFFEHLGNEVQRARRYRRIFSLLMLDLDHFKNYNDTHGHLRGDAALKDVARLLERNTRGADVVARYGGEEFVVLLPEVDQAGGIVAAEKIRAAVERHAFFGRSRQPGGKMTVSIGVATYPEDSADGRALVDVADRAMYASKQRGGNRVTVLSGPRAGPSHHQKPPAPSTILTPSDGDAVRAGIELRSPTHRPIAAS